MRAQADADAVRLLLEAGHYLGIAIASLANIFFPDKIVLAGGLSRAGSLLLDVARASFQHHGGTFAVKKATLVVAETERHATLLGAAAVHFLREDGFAGRHREAL